MIILKLIGGLGNQMFQIAFARMLSLEYGEEIYVDASVYKKYKIRELSISNLNISNSFKFIENTKIPKIDKLYLKFSQKTYHLYQKIVRLINGNGRIGEKSYRKVASKGFLYNFDSYYYDVAYNNKLKCLYGYFQSEKYFEKYKEQILEELKVKVELNAREEKLLSEITVCNAVGVSMRLGEDYINSSLLNVCTEDFYYRGMEYIYNKNKDAVFYIFSDDLSKAKKQYQFKYQVRFIEGFKDYESLRLLYSCKHFVIANSSFSWWGAYLSNNPDKIVVAPSRWDNCSKEVPDIYYSGMTLINV